MTPEEVSFDEVVAVWLAAEWHYAFYDNQRSSIPAKMLETPDLLNVSENLLRKELLALNRSPILNQLPEGIVWYKQPYLKEDIGRTRLIRTTWCLTLTHGDCKLESALANGEGVLPPEREQDARKIREIRSSDVQNSELIFVASHLEGTLTCIDGNHRLVALTSKALAADSAVLFPKVYVGVSAAFNTAGAEPAIQGVIL